MAKTLADLITDKLGVRTTFRINPEASSIGTSVARVFGNNPNRVAWVFINLSANAIYLAPDPAPSSSRGIRVGQNGGSLAATWEEDFDIVGLEWNGVADGASSNYFALELVTLEPTT